MSDLKSKIPDLSELTNMATELFKGIKQSVTKIVDDYKRKRVEEDTGIKEDLRPTSAASPVVTPTPEIIVPPTSTTSPEPIYTPGASIHSGTSQPTSIETPSIETELKKKKTPIIKDI